MGQAHTHPGVMCAQSAPPRECHISAHITRTKQVCTCVDVYRTSEALHQVSNQSGPPPTPNLPNLGTGRFHT